MERSTNAKPNEDGWRQRTRVRGGRCLPTQRTTAYMTSGLVVLFRALGNLTAGGMMPGAAPICKGRGARVD